MELNLYGSYLLKFLCICHYLLLSRIKYLVSMEDYHPKSNILIKLSLLIEYKIYHIMGRYVICCGLILLIKVNLGSVHRLEVQVFVGDRI